MTDHPDPDRDAEIALAERMLRDGIQRTMKFIMDRSPELSADEAALVMGTYVDDEARRIKERLGLVRWMPTTTDVPRPVGTGHWWEPHPSTAVYRCSIAVRDERPHPPPDGDAVVIAFARCDVAAWDEARDKERVGTLNLSRSQAVWLRDALTTILNAKETA